MKNITKYAFMALLLFCTNKILSQNTQVNDSIISVDLDEVVVSIPFKESLKNNVLRVNKLNIKNLNYIKSQNFSKSLIEIPGLSLITTGPGIAKPVIRGLSSNRVVVFNQNMRQENQQWGGEHGMDISGFGVESVELIKGPMSVIYGSDAIGGVLYVHPDSYTMGNKTDFLNEDLEVEIGSYYNSNYKGFTNNLGVKGNLNNLSYLIQGSVVDNKDFETPKEKVESTYFENKDLKLGLGYESEKFISDFRFNYSKTKVGIPHSEHEDEDHEDEEHEEHEEESYQDLTNSIVTWKNTFLFDNKSEFEIILGRSLNNRKEFGEYEEEHEDEDEDHDEEEHEEHEGEAHIDFDLNTTTVDMKYLFPKKDKSELVLGSNILFQENKNIGEEALIPDAKKNDFGIYGLTHIHSVSWDILIGLRADFRNIKQTDFDKNFSRLTSSLGFKRKLGEKGVMRINFSRGYRAPNLSELFSEGVHHGTAQYEIGNKNLKEERSSQIDLSIVTSTSNSTFGMDIFYNKLSDYIYLNPTGNKIGDFKVYNYLQEDASLFGGEIFLSKKTSLDWLSHKTSLAYVSGEKANKGGYLPLIPPVTLKHSFNFEFDNNSFEISALAKGKKQNIGQFETKTNSYFVMDISGSHDFNFLENSINLSWSINNLFDREYYDHLSRLKNMEIYEIGRNISFGLNYNF
ncbi:MAG: TonB-dependent receptor [Flavobacteriaceae bacterium]|nr:TonB-dependent receptor [Flavobacteriaceae bacterium]